MASYSRGTPKFVVTPAQMELNSTKLSRILVGQILLLYLLFLDALAIHSRCRQDAPGYFEGNDYLMRFHRA